MSESDDFDRWCERSEPADDSERAPECGCGCELRTFTERSTGTCWCCAGELADWYEDNGQIEDAEAA